MARPKRSDPRNRSDASEGRLSLKPSGSKKKPARPSRRIRAVADIPASGPRTVPTRWLKAVAGFFLLPVCWVAGKTFWEEFARATLHGRFLASDELHYFLYGVAAWLVVFFVLPKMLLVYVFGHELTHAIWVLVLGGRVSAFKVGREGGYIIADRRDFLVSLAPYFFPLYSIVVIGVFGVAGFFYPAVWDYQKYLFMAVGLTWAFHFTFTCWMIPKKQTDLLLHGTFFSLVVIYLANLLVLAILFVVACPQVTWAGLGRQFVQNAAEFSDWACRQAGVHPWQWLERARRRH